ncbi:hypothetical protein [Caballeronia sp. INDeC2]|uniref:hypothetical protein n=1 Tax=Caballeronia sp. INDeC2 TaxID=2921747 RepID=UPI002027886E|nr:hypothetical protein [Caballeronia sp. INDeC2]
MRDAARKSSDGKRLRLAGVRPIFDDYIAANVLQERLRFHAGDFSKSCTTGICRRRCEVVMRRCSRAAALIDDERRQNALGF